MTRQLNKIWNFIKIIFICFFLQAFQLEPNVCHDDENIQAMKAALKNSGDLTSASIEAEKTCSNIDLSLATTNLYFNPKGRQASYLSSECFSQLADISLNDKYCSHVKEYKTINPLIDGSYFSPKSCCVRIHDKMQQKFDHINIIINTPKIDPKYAHKIKDLNVNLVDGKLLIQAELENPLAQEGLYFVDAKILRTLGGVQKDFMLGGVQFKDNNKAQPYTTIENYYKDFTKAFYEQLNTTIIKSSDKQLLLIVPAFYLSPFLTMMADDLRFNVSSSWNIEVSLELIKQEKAIADPARRPEYNTTKNFNLAELLRSFQTSTQKQVIVNPSDVQRLESIELIMENDNKLKVTMNLGGAKVDGRYAILINARDQNSGIYFIPIAPFIHKETILLPATKPFTPISDNVIDIGAQERTVSFYIPIHQIEWLYDRPNLNLSVQLQFIKSKDQGVLDTNNTNAYLSEQKILIYPAIRKN